MFQVPSLVFLLGLTLCVVPSHGARAQQFNENGVVYEAGRNKIGLIRYCRNNALLDPIVADQAVTAVETGLRELPSSDSFDTEQGDLAQQAGEEGFWDSGRKRDIAGVATLFRTTPADLCREWADETLRAQAPRPYRVVKTITVAPPKPFQPLPQAEPAAPEPIEAERPPARASEVVIIIPARTAPIPPLPEKAPGVPPASQTQLVSWQRALPAGAPVASTPTAAITPAAVPQSSAQPAPLPVPLATEAAAPPPREQTAAAAEPVPPLDVQPQPVGRENRLFRRLGKAERCLMPGCRWSTPQERGSWR